MGKRNLRLTSCLRRIYNLASKESWSDTYLFVRDKCSIQDEEILISEDSVGRALKQMCEKANVRYLPPHQIRFANATQMARNGAEAYQIQKFLGHTTPIMSTRYIRAYEKMTFFLDPPGPKMKRKKKNPKRFVHKHLRLSQARREPDLNRRILVLQTIALPLGYRAIYTKQTA